MILSRDRILTTHVGSLPRNEGLSELLVQREAGEAYDKVLFDAEMEKAIRHVVAKQKAAGIDSGNDGEQQRVGFQTYIRNACPASAANRSGGAAANSRNFRSL
jgi:5-methyltetrahydropteroyltriglutamate--homocysteine methyltransferase